MYLPFSVTQSEKPSTTPSNSDSEYIPESHVPNSSDSELSDVDYGGSDSKINDCTASKRMLKAPTFNESEIIVHEGKSAGDDKNMYISFCDEERRKNACLFCKKTVTQISKHLQKMHKNEEKIQRVLKLPKGDDKNKLLAELRVSGNAEFNRSEYVNKGQLIVTRRSRKVTKNTARNYTVCAFCKGSFSKKSIRKHFRKCSGKNDNSRMVLAVGRLAADRIASNATARTRKEIAYIRDDEVGRIIRQDKLVIEYANQLTLKYKLPHEQDMIRARLRLIARFLIAIQEIDSQIVDLTAVFDPKHYDAAIAAINVVARYNSKEEIYDAPTNASQLGTFLKVIGKKLISVCIRNHDRQKKRVVEEFLDLHSDEFAIRVNRTVSETQIKMACQKKIQLPCDEDIKRLYSFVENKRISAYANLKKTFTDSNRKILGETILLSILIFNRRRPGELERMLIDDFKNRSTITSNSNKQLLESLSEEARRAVETYQRVAIRGKKGRIVPILITKDIVDCIEILNQTRNQARISPENPYVFGIYNYVGKKNKFLRACEIMKIYANECGAEKPELLRATHLRKHIATKCVSLKLSETQIDDLANHLGHHKDIHKKYYRQPIPELEITKVAGLLEDIMETETDGENCEDNDAEPNAEDLKLEQYEKQQKDIRKFRKRPREYLKLCIYYMHPSQLIDYTLCHTLPTYVSTNLNYFT